MKEEDRFGRDDIIDNLVECEAERDRLQQRIDVQCEDCPYFAAATAQVDELQEELAATKRRLSEACEREIALTDQHTELREDLESEQRAKHQTVKLLMDTRRQLAALWEKNDSLRIKVAAAEVFQRDNKKTCDRLRRERNDLREALLDSQSTIQQLEDSLEHAGDDALCGQLSKLREALSDSIGTLEGIVFTRTILPLSIESRIKQAKAALAATEPKEQS